MTGTIVQIKRFIWNRWNCCCGSRWLVKRALGENDEWRGLIQSSVTRAPTIPINRPSVSTFFSALIAKQIRKRWWLSARLSLRNAKYFVGNLVPTSLTVIFYVMLINIKYSISVQLSFWLFFFCCSFSLFTQLTSVWTAICTHLSRKMRDEAIAGYFGKIYHDLPVSDNSPFCRYTCNCDDNDDGMSKAYLVRFRIARIAFDRINLRPPERSAALLDTHKKASAP